MSQLCNVQCIKICTSNKEIKTVACEINELINIRLIILLSDFFFNPWILPGNKWYGLSS